MSEFNDHEIYWSITNGAWSWECECGESGTAVDGVEGPSGLGVSMSEHWQAVAS